MNGIKANARMRVEQDVDLVLKNPKLKISGQPHDGVPFTTDPGYKHYKADEDCITPKDGLLFRRVFRETGSVKCYKILIPTHLVIEVIRRLNTESKKQPRSSKSIIAYRRKKCFPKKAQLIREWVMSCEECIREQRIDRNLNHPALLNPNEHITTPEDATQNALLPELPPSGGHEDIVTAKNVFSR